MDTLTGSGVSLPPARPPMPTRRILGAYFNETKFEFLGALRTIGFAVPFLLLPVMIYLLFGVAMSGDAITKNPRVADFLFCSFSVFAISGPAVFGIGVGLAMERDAGLVKWKRALPLPPGSYLLAKMLMAMIFAALTFTSLLITALIVGKLTLSAGQLTALAAVMIIGALPFVALGLFIGVYFSGSVAPAIGNLVYLPSIWLGGLFIPLPKFLQAQAVVWPTFHLNQIATGIAGLEEFHVVPSLVSLGVLVGVTVLFGGLAIHRLARKG